MHLAVYHPAIPQNTGNLGRLCVGFSAHLHIIGPCFFDFSDKALRRAGLDYWPHLDWTLHEDDEAFLDWLGDRQPWLITKFASIRFDQADYQSDDVLLVGNENSGLPESWHDRWPDRRIAIPMSGPIRSFNQANAAAMVIGMATSRSGGFDHWQP
jgi:tRNA (cytidine/uridine-2'-O-)-methyltransferase